MGGKAEKGMIKTLRRDKRDGSICLVGHNQTEGIAPFFL
jgi:hypothetical protein